MISPVRNIVGGREIARPASAFSIPLRFPRGTIEPLILTPGARSQLSHFVSQVSRHGRVNLNMGRSILNFDPAKLSFQFRGSKASGSNVVRSPASRYNK